MRLLVNLFDGEENVRLLDEIVEAQEYRALYSMENQVHIQWLNAAKEGKEIFEEFGLRHLPVLIDGSIVIEREGIAEYIKNC